MENENKKGKINNLFLSNSIAIEERARNARRQRVMLKAKHTKYRALCAASCAGLNEWLPSDWSFNADTLRDHRQV